MSTSPANVPMSAPLIASLRNAPSRAMTTARCAANRCGPDSWASNWKSASAGVTISSNDRSVRKRSAKAVIAATKVTDSSTSRSGACLGGSQRERVAQQLIRVVHFESVLGGVIQATGQTDGASRPFLLAFLARGNESLGLHPGEGDVDRTAFQSA